MIFTYIIIKKEENKLDIKVSKILLIFYNPFYLLSYIYCLYIAITKKDLGWQEIKHTIIQFKEKIFTFQRNYIIIYL